MSITPLPAVALDGVTKTFGRGDGAVCALDGVSVAFASGTFTAIMGPSGSGKTTLLQCAAARAALERVGLGERAGHRPAQLSGGQQQRVAIARALVTEPEVIFADEPTGALDTRSARDVLGMLRDATDRDGRTLVMVTHDVPAALAGRARVIALAGLRE
jgi:ABC-type lipoprotein export system ATPase subunit